ncbi:hypothetical protein AYI70_g579 [Smittium culicis]|uniref:Uncharacterized protein n=1 Tax=Smittium culicis TaxID=133412 RepID=A0A1R1YGA6_9FUNG|nr:hypothetical protein AYI70_g579 [Smittium culicis]
MFFIPGIILNAGLTIWTARFGSVRFKQEQESVNIFQLVPEHQHTGKESSGLQMIQFQHHLQMPTLESDIPGGSEGLQRTTENKLVTPMWKSAIWFPDLNPLYVAQPLILQAKTVIRDPKSGKSSLSENKHWSLMSWKISGVSSKRKVSELMPLILSFPTNDVSAVDPGTVLSSSAFYTGESQTRYLRQFLRLKSSTTWRKFTLWISSNVGSIKTYKSAILQLSDNPVELAAHPMFSEFIKSLDENSIKSFIRPVMDISPVIKLLREWGQNSTLTVKQITAKLCWLLPVTGFLRASDIHRIDDQRSHIDQGVLNLVIVAPKEKRGGRPIEKPCQINPHTDKILCPVNAYMVYKEKIAVNLCPTPHANNSNWVVNRLIRYVNDTSKPLSVDSITRYIHTISDLIRRDPEAPIPKGRAIAPKEKRGGRPIEKPCQINPHTDKILCPVNAYMVYKEKIAVNLCPTPHANNSNWVVNRLIRYVNDTSKPLSVDSITRYIHTISDLIRRDPEAPIPKGRAIGATLAANAGVSSDDIVSHAFWSNYTIFDTYYRLSRNSSNNLTESILNLE